MKRTAITGTVAIGAAVAIMLSGCGSDTKTKPSDATSREGFRQCVYERHGRPVIENQSGATRRGRQGAESDDRKLHRGEQHSGDSHQDG